MATCLVVLARARGQGRLASGPLCLTKCILYNILYMQIIDIKIAIMLYAPLNITQECVHFQPGSSFAAYLIGNLTQHS